MDIWKRCFGDQEKYIDFYFAHRYKEDQTVLLLENGKIAAMFSMFPVTTVTPDHRSFESAMIYAFATHPEYQNRSLATRMMDFSDQYFKANRRLSRFLFHKSRNFFALQQARLPEAFYIKETRLTLEMIGKWGLDDSIRCKIEPAAPEAYNLRRNMLLTERLYVAYTHEDIRYQKKLSQRSGADIYTLDIEGMQGCAVVERFTADKVLIKEIIVPDAFILTALKYIAQEIPAQEYLLRMPAFVGEPLGGTIRPFGMTGTHRNSAGDRR
jgi:GNAT superfamily N-acetyltransferase